MNREECLESLEKQNSPLDFIVIGGGATGLGIGLDAASRAYSVLVLEAGDFAGGTSSNSTKLVHGGVRYLQRGNIALVIEALHERGLLLRNAPHLVYNREFLVPDYHWWERPFYGIGLKLYDMLAGKHGFGKSRILSKKETLLRIPALKTEGLNGGVIYHDGQFDDARLAVTLVHSLKDAGGLALNHVSAEALLKDENAQISGVLARDQLSGKTLKITARAVINAAGPFVDSIRLMDSEDAKPLISPSQGIHIVLDKSFAPMDTAIMVPYTDDGRVIFMVPWYSRVLVGTTDTPLSNISLKPKALRDEIDFLLLHASRYLDKKPGYKDILSVFAGIRPLIKGSDNKNTSALSRDFHLSISASGLVSIAGGKWTTYRKMAEDTIDKAIPLTGLPFRPCRTARLPLHGYTKDNLLEDPFHYYGSDKPLVEALAEKNAELLLPLDRRLPYRAVDVIWAVRYEMARTLEDVLSRRTRALVLDARAALDISDRVLDIMAEELGRDEEWKKREKESFAGLVSDSLPL